HQRLLKLERSRCGFSIEIFCGGGEQILFVLVAKQGRQRRIAVQKLALRRAEEGSLGQRLKQVAEAALALTLVSYITRQGANGAEFPFVAPDGVQNAVIVADAVVALEPNRKHSCPLLAFDELSQAAVGEFAGRLVQEFLEAMPHDLRKIPLHQLRKGAVGRLDYSVRGESNDNLVEAVDQFTIVPLRFGDGLH